MSDSTSQSDTKQDNNGYSKDQQLFLSLVTSMHMGAMYQLGKMASPISGKIERDMRQAQYTIDLLAMLQAKTEGNLAADESEHLRRIVSELRLNYIDESAKPDIPQESEDTTEETKETEEPEETEETKMAGAPDNTKADTGAKSETSE